MKPQFRIQLFFALAATLIAISLSVLSRVALAAPTITANPNPVIIPAGKTEGATLITWDAGADRSDSRVWLQVDNGREDLFAASAKGSSEIKVVMGKTYLFKLYSGDGTQVLASITVKAQPPKPSLPNIPQSAPGARPAYIYGVLPDGTLRWYRHDGRGRGSSVWQGPRDITTGLQGLRQVFAGSDQVDTNDEFYTIAPNGDLRWFKHSSRDTAGDLPTRGTDVPQNVGNGWQNFKHVFSAGAGTIYAVAQDGTLKWYRYERTLIYGDKPWTGPRDVSSGWGNFKSVFSTGNGIIYAITQEGKLLWHKHNFYKYGAGSEAQGGQGQAAWEGPKEVGTGWQNFRHVFSSGDGIIYAVTKEGKLLWYKHQGFLTGAKIWLGPREVASAGWENFEHVFALLDRQTYDSDRTKPSEVKRVPPVFSTPPASFFRDLIVQPMSNGVTIAYSPSYASRTMIALSTQKPYSLPDTVSSDQANKVSTFPQEAKASVHCSDVGDWYSNAPSGNRRNCQIGNLAPNTTYYFVIIADTYEYVEKRVGRDEWKSGPSFYYSGSFKTKGSDTLRPRKF